MDEPIEVVSAVAVVGPYLIEVSFTDGVQGFADVEPYLNGAIFAPLRDPARFAEAFVDHDAGTVVWPNGADLSPESTSELSRPAKSAQYAAQIGFLALQGG